MSPQARRVTWPPPAGRLASADLQEKMHVSDTPQGPGWWQASDGKRYPPEQAPGTPSGGGRVGTLDTGAAIGYGWNKFVQYIGQIIIIVLIIFGVQIVFQVLRT